MIELVLNDRTEIGGAIGALLTRIEHIFASGNQVQVVAKPYRETRSTAQNRLYWRWVGEIAKATGHNKRDIADYYQSELLEPVVSEFNGKRAESIRSTKELDTAEFSEFLQQFQQMADEGGFQLTSFDDLLKLATGIK